MENLVKVCKIDGISYPLIHDAFIVRAFLMLVVVCVNMQYVRNVLNYLVSIINVNMNICMKKRKRIYANHVIKKEMTS